MCPAPNDLFLAVTTADGSAYTTTRQGNNGSWSAFNKVVNLIQTGRKNVGVTVSFDQQLCAVNDAPVRQLRYTKDLTGTTRPVLVRSGVAPAAAENGAGGLSLAVLGIGPKNPNRPPNQPQWSFTLPLSLIKTDQTVIDAGDELDSIDPGALNLSEFAIALDIAGTFNETTRSYHLLLATSSGNIYHAHRSGTARSRFEFAWNKGTLPAEFDPVTVSCSPGNEGLHLVLAPRNGRLLHLIRFPSGQWSSVGDVMAATDSNETFTKVAISYFNLPGGRTGILHVVGVTRSGGLFYASRTAEHTADPLWTTFLDVKKAGAGDKGPVTSVDIAVQP